jgi:glycine hydroxymethyltransferase
MPTVDIMNSDVSSVFENIKKHHEFFQSVIPLIASENVTSLSVRKALISDFAHRYAEGKVGERYYQGCKYIDEVEALAIKLSKKLFNAEHVNVQPISGVTANLASFFALTDPGDILMALSVPHGGHISHSNFSAAGIRGLTILHHPFDSETMNIDPDKMHELILKENPKVILFGSSVFLFPHPISEAREAADEVGARIVYDGSHVLGLIAGKEFQDPLREGVDVLAGSTHKTFFGPQRGIILTTEELAEKIDKSVFPGIVSNHHLHSLAGYAIAAAEMLAFGKDYARQTVKNAQTLASELYNLGFDVLCENHGFTKSHQVVVDVSSIGGGKNVSDLLEKAGVILNSNLLPWDDVSKSHNPSGIRIGVQEVTRLGMKENEMQVIAEFIYDATIGKKDPMNVRNRVTEFREEFSRVEYSFDRNPAYQLTDIRW